MKDKMKNAYVKLRDRIYIHLPALYINLHLLKIRLQGAGKNQRRMEKGAFWLERGVRFQIGQPVHVRRSGRVRVQYIRNLYYDFLHRKVTALYSERPIKGYSEKFKKKKSK